METAIALTDRTGAFTFLGVPPGQYTLRGNKFDDGYYAGGRGGPPPNAWWIAEPVTVGNQDVSIAATWRDALSLSGRIVFDGVNAPPASRLAQMPIVVEASAQGQIAGLTPARVQPDLTFTTSRVPAGRYLLRIGSAPTGWALRSVMYDGRDISDTAVDLKGAANDIVMTFTDRITSLAGNVRTMQGTAAADTSVLLFPADPAGWQDFGLNPRRFKTARVDDSGSYKFADIPPGDYLVVAISEEDTAVWRTPARLTALSRLATRIHVNEGDKATQELRQVSVR
jgi:hypothetical protein